MVCLLQVNWASRFGLFDLRMRYQVGGGRPGWVFMTVSNIYTILGINSSTQTIIQCHKLCITVITQWGNNYWLSCSVDCMTTIHFSIVNWTTNSTTTIGVYPLWQMCVRQVNDQQYFMFSICLTVIKWPTLGVLSGPRDPIPLRHFGAKEILAKVDLMEDQFDCPWLSMRHWFRLTCWL